MTDAAGGAPLSLATQLPLFGAHARAARRAVRRHVNGTGLAEAQVEVLRTVEADPGIGVRLVAERLQLVPNTVSTIVGELVGAGLLTRERDEADRRAARLSLTPAAVERLASWGAAREEVLAAALLRLDDADQRAIGQAVPAMRRLLLVLDEAAAGPEAGRTGTTTGQSVTGSRSTADSTP